MRSAARAMSAAGHGVVGDVDGHGRRVGGEGGGDLLGGQDQATRGVQHQVDGDVVVGHLDGPDHGFGVVDVDVAAEGDAEEGEALPAVDEGDDPAAVAPLQGADGLCPLEGEQLLL